MVMGTKAEFITNFMNQMRDYFLENVGKTPDEWDGIELRQWIAEKMQGETYQMSRKRKRDYNNEVIVRNL